MNQQCQEQPIFIYLFVYLFNANINRDSSPTDYKFKYN
jgi:hypothetical protein